ncbi:MAG: SIR2 family protein, partial [Thiomargarita sp.]|nr:SIR2 family protein [Thiomargarita sp.]
YKWSPVKESAIGEFEEDICILELSPESVLPNKAQPIPIIVLEQDAHFNDRAVRMFGFPEDKENGDWLNGTLQGTIGNGRVQLESEVGRRGVLPGFSGTAIWDKEENAVIGMMVSIYAGEVDTSAYMIPAYKFIEVSPELEQVATIIKKRTLLTNKMRELETKMEKITKEIDEAQHLERNHAYPQALERWKNIQSLLPDDIRASEAIQALEEKIALKNRVIDFQKRLIKHFKALGATSFQQINERLKRMIKEGVDDDAETLLNFIEQFLNQEISVDVLTDFWSSLDSQPSNTRVDALNYQTLAARLQRGDIVIFLGSDLLPSLCDQTLSNAEIVKGLADYVNYPDFNGDFPEICEYFDLDHNFGRQLLCDQLKTLVEPKTPSIALYQLFALLRKPLLLISATYDTHLEQTFQAHNKKFVVLYHHSDKKNTDTLFLDYSDQTKTQQSSSENLSELPLLEQGYSVIYKMLGRVDGSSAQGLVIAEKDYFTFSQYQDKLIPSYISEWLRTRGLWLLGYHPKSWEKRLILKTILSKRAYEEPALTIFQQADKFASLYLKNKQIENYPIDLKEFVENLQAQLS